MKLLPGSLAVLVLIGTLATGALADDRRTYIVQLAAEPAASYNGNLAGFAATQPLAGARFNARSRASLAYKGYLDAQQSSVAALVAKAQIVARYSTVYNGFAARLTDAEVTALRNSPLVVDIHVDEARKMDTISTSAFLGLSKPGGLWSQLVGGVANKGEDIIIGIVDGGIWPESPSYADQISGGVPVFSGGASAYGPAPAGWLGSCTAGAGFVPATHCNNKLIGAQFFNAGFLASGRVQHWTEFTSPRDSVAGASGHGGHGSHTSSTAGGNSGAPVTIAGVAMGPASGMAPRARIAAYKVCWTYVDATAADGTGTTNSCFTSDSVLAIDKAVADGVHVINYSISGSQTSVNDPVEQAFLRATNAGVFVAASAGNSGPAQAVAHVSPWLTTVAASTHDRAFRAAVTLGNAAKYFGASASNVNLAASSLVRAEDAGQAGGDASLCYSGTPPSGQVGLDPAKVAGKVVICTRGGNARVDKSMAVLNAGGVGMVMMDNGGGLVADNHSVPTVHVSTADGQTIKNYAVATGASATAALAKTAQVSIPAPIMAGFSSRGPNIGDANMLKPDLTAPGVDVIATVTPALSQAQRDAVAAGTLVPPPAWASYQGTSMSSPHVAGLAALIKQAHPTWSPAAIKSALMTTAFSTLDDGVAGSSNGLLPWSQGAGHVDPNKATDPGLVYNNGPVEFIRYQCKVNKPAVIPASDCTLYGTLDETYNFNLPSITVGSVVGPATVIRKVTNVGAASATYNASFVTPTGFSIVVNPTTLTLAPGAVGAFTVKLTNAGAVTNVWGYGSMTWSDGVHQVKIPVTARAGKPIEVTAQINGNTNSGTRLITVKTGFAGRMTANKGGLKDVTMGPTVALVGAALSQAALKAVCTAGVDTVSTKVYSVTIPAGTIVARFALRDADVGAAGDDNDMMLLAPDGSTVYSGNDGSNEAVQVSSPAAGTYKVCVTAYAGAASMTHKLSSWVVTTADTSSNFNVLLPGTVYSGSTATVGLSWAGLTTGSRYVGGVQFKDASGTVQATTALRVEPNGGLPLTDMPRSVTTQQLSK